MERPPAGRPEVGWLSRARGGAWEEGVRLRVCGALESRQRQAARGAVWGRRCTAGSRPLLPGGGQSLQQLPNYLFLLIRRLKLPLQPVALRSCLIPRRRAHLVTIDRHKRVDYDRQ